MKRKYITYGMLGVLLIASSCKKAQEQSEEQTEQSSFKEEGGYKLEINTGNTAYKYDADASKLDKSTSGVQTSSEQTPAASYIDKVAYYPEEISSGLSVTPSYDFFQGLQSPYDSDVWIYMERQRIGAGYHLYQYNVTTNKKTILISESNPNWEKLAFKPIGWSKEAGKIYLEALYLDNAQEHEGIWIYDIDKKVNSELKLPFKYMRTPVLTPNRDNFIIVGTDDITYDPLHGLSDVLFEFDIKTRAHKTLLTTKGEDIIIQGWKRTGAQTKAMPTKFKTSALSYYLPWDFGTDYCVSRHGTPAPSGTHTYVGTCNFSSGGQHTYAAVDFATPTDRVDNVRAAAAGQVTFAGISGSLTSGYGRLVIITHSDGTRSYYAHNSSLLVTSGQDVPQGFVVAKEGSTGGSTGDHIHFEFRAAGGSASTMGTFVGIGQPRQNFKYRSNNSTTVPVINTPGTYQIDINHTTQITKPGWNGLIGTEGNTITINGNKFTMFGGIQGTRDRGSLGEVNRDFAFNEGPSVGVGIRMEGLPAGTYNVTTWNYDLDYPGLVDVEFREAGLTGTTEVKLTGRSLTDSAGSTFQIVVVAGKNYEIIVRENSIEDRSRFNGIELILVP